MSLQLGLETEHTTAFQQASKEQAFPTTGMYKMVSAWITPRRVDKVCAERQSINAETRVALQALETLQGAPVVKGGGSQEPNRVQARPVTQPTGSCH